MTHIRQQAEHARKAFLKLSTSVDRTEILKQLASALLQNAPIIFEANQRDLAAAKASGIAEPLYKRLALNESKLRDVIAGIEQIADMPDPVGRTGEDNALEHGLILR